MGAEEALAEALMTGLAALRSGRWHEAVARLRPVCDDPRLARATDLRDVRARACSLLAQALLHTGDLREAEGRAEAALRLVRALGDTEGIDDVTTLLAEIHHRASQASRPEAPAAPALEAPAPPSLEAARALRDPGMRSEALLRLATARLTAGEAAGALEAARCAWEEADTIGKTRVVVLARLCAAHADPDRASEHLHAAWAAADASDEAEHLLGPVARAAEVLGLPLHQGRAPIGGRA